MYRNSIAAAIPQIITMLGNEHSDVRSSASNALAKLLSNPDIYYNARMPATPRITSVNDFQDFYDRFLERDALTKLSKQTKQKKGK